MRRALLSLSALLLLSGCSTYVTVVTEPEGAMISDPTGSQLYGYSPVKIEYDTDLLRNQGGLVPGYRATWQSGATAQTESPFYINDLQYGATVKLVRPEGAPGLEKDLDFALKRSGACPPGRSRARPSLPLHGPRLGLGARLGMGSGLGHRRGRSFLMPDQVSFRFAG